MIALRLPSSCTAQVGTGHRPTPVSVSPAAERFATRRATGKGAPWGRWTDGWRWSVAEGGASAAGSPSGWRRRAPRSPSTTARTPTRRPNGGRDRAGRGAAKAYAASVDDAEADAAMVEAVVADFGSVDILVDNAGDRVAGQRRRRHRSGRGRARARHPRLRRPPPVPAGAAVDADTAARRHRDDLVGGHVGAWRANGAPYNMAKAALEALALTLAKEETAQRHPRQHRRPRPRRDRHGRPPGPGDDRQP